MNLWFFELLLFPFALIFNPITIWLYPILVFLYYNRFSTEQILKPLFNGLYLLIWIIAALLLIKVLKKGCARKRPYEINAGRRCSFKRKGYGEYSLPSGDTTQAMLFVSYMIWINGWSQLWWILVGLVAFSRLFYQANWLFDILVGALLGLGLGLAAT